MMIITDFGSMYCIDYRVNSVVFVYNNNDYNDKTVPFFYKIHDQRARFLNSCYYILYLTTMLIWIILNFSVRETFFFCEMKFKKK